MTLATTKAGALVSPLVGMEQPLQQTASHPVRGAANSHLTGLQVDMPLVSDISEGPLHQPAYILRRLGEMLVAARTGPLWRGHLRQRRRGSMAVRRNHGAWCLEGHHPVATEGG